MNRPRIPIKIYAAALALLLCSFSLNVDSDNDFYPDERNALLHIRDSVPSTANLHSLWTGPPCRGNSSRWPGIACENGHVVHLVLQGINLTGNLPAGDFLRNITFLTKLSLVNNSISGSLPNLTGLVRMEQVLLSSNGFTGSIPPDYASSLPSLQFLELERNSLEGRIPSFNQSGLTRFNVSYNRLGGPIPKTETLERFPASSFDHNSGGLCGPPLAACPVIPPPLPPIPSPPAPEERTKRRFNLWLIVVIALGAAILAFLLVMLCLIRFRKQGKGKQTPEGVSYIEWSEGRKVYSGSGTDPERTVELDFFVKEIPAFDLEDLLRASAEVLGKGKNGSTYKATLESGSVVAVKRLRKVNVLSQKEFVQQMQLLGNLKHHNLAPVISFYYSPDQKLIIYEFVPGGNLHELLHENRGMGRMPLDWTARLSIIKDIAKGLAYLHASLPSHRAPHGNLKSSNVLVHREGLTYYCKLTDYGLLPLLQTQKVSERLAVGRSPEYGQGKRLSHKADVYCFGIVLLEAITGKIPEDGPPRQQRDKEGTTSSVEDLSGWVRSAVNSDWSTDILDLEIMQAREGHGEMFQLTDLALECTCVLPEKRPKMAEVVRRIEEIEQRRK
ncbi:Probable inactive receptor kinase At1g48480 [Linum grandiflorum]